MEEDIYLHKLNLRNVKPTAIRLFILRTMMEMNRAVSQPDLEEKLQTVDNPPYSAPSRCFWTIT